MIVLILILLVFLLPIGAFSPMTTLKNCPKILPDANVKLDKVVGTWRLAYVYVDDAVEMEEDNSCGVVEIMRINETQMEILLYLDNRKDEVTIDRYTKEFEVTVQSPGEWLINTSLKYLEFIHVTVISFLGDHIILTFCVNSINPDISTSFTSSDNKDILEHNSFANAIEEGKTYKTFKEPAYESLLRNLGLWKMKENPSVVRDGVPFLRRKRYATNGIEESYREFLTKKFGRNEKKHLWTAILSRNNKVSALEYIENASYLMKYGFDIVKGQFISFGSCGTNK